MWRFLLRGLVLFLSGWFVWRYVSPKFNLPCPAWLYWALERENPFARYSRANEIIAGLDLQEGMSVLDVGCGPGRLSIPLAKSVGGQGEVISIDMQQKMLDIVAQKAAQQQLTNITTLKIALGEGQLAHCNADRAVLAAVLGELPNRAATLKEIYDALKPGGILAISETLFDPHYQKSQSVEELVKPLGFRQIELRGNKLAYTLYLQK